MSEAIREATPRREASPIRLEAALNDLAGAASLAALVFDAIADDAEKAESESFREGLRWLTLHLGSAAETALALYERRAPRFHTMMEAEEIIAELGKAQRLAVMKEAGR